MIVGPSGVGKTSLINIIMGLIKPNSGSVRITDDSGQIQLKDVDINDWLTKISWVPQDPHFPSGTIQEFFNLSSPEATNHEISRVLQRVGLSGINLDKPVALSVGQKRRLAIARALLHPHQVLIMDEPSAALDPESEALIIEIVKSQTAAGKIVIAISHRADFIAAADYIFALERVNL